MHTRWVSVTASFAAYCARHEYCATSFLFTMVFYRSISRITCGDSRGECILMDSLAGNIRTCRMACPRTRLNVKLRLLAELRRLVGSQAGRGVYPHVGMTDYPHVGMADKGRANHVLIFLTITGKYNMPHHYGCPIAYENHQHSRLSSFECHLLGVLGAQAPVRISRIFLVS